MNFKNEFVSLNNKNISIWFVMAFQAGAINAGGLMACHRLVTHTTGFATHFGVEFAQGNYVAAFGMLTVPVFFIIGAMISAYFIDLRLQENRAPNYRTPAILITIILLITAITGQLGLYGGFQNSLVIARDYLFMVLLCMASGIQNAMLCNAHGTSVRTTHLTGLSTDLAVGLVRFFFHKDAIKHQHEAKASLARMGTVLCFVLGSMLAALIFIKMQYLGFWVPTLTSILLWKYVFQ